MVPECKHCAVRDSGGSFLHSHERYCNTLRSGFVEKMSLSFVTFASQMTGVKGRKGDVKGIRMGLRERDPGRISFSLLLRR